jgi:hypothetical protein
MRDFMEVNIETTLSGMSSRVVWQMDAEDGGCRFLRNIGSHLIAWSHIPEKHNLDAHRRENLKYDALILVPTHLSQTHGCCDQWAFADRLTN